MAEMSGAATVPPVSGVAGASAADPPALWSNGVALGADDRPATKATSASSAAPPTNQGSPVRRRPAACGACAPAPIGAPQSEQNRAPAGTAAPQAAQVAPRAAAPQPVQKRPLTASPHRGQCSSECCSGIRENSERRIQ